MRVLFVTGTGTGVGKTIATAALASCAIGRADLARPARVAVVKPGQTGVDAGQPGDIDDVRRLAPGAQTHEFIRYRYPLAPAAAARMEGRDAPDLLSWAPRLMDLAAQNDMLIIEGAGGLLVRYDAQGHTIADLAAALGAPLVVVADPALGTLNHTGLTLEAMERRGLECAGVILGRWSHDPGMDCRSNLVDLPLIDGFDLVGALPEGLGAASATDFARIASQSLSPAFGGTFDASDFLCTNQLLRSPA